MAQRIEYSKVAPGALKAITGMELYVRQSGLEPELIALIKLRASFINGCAYCVDMHTKDALAAGETDQRLFAVPVWRETPFFTDRERAVLAFTEAVTAMGPHGVSDELFAEVRSHFSEADVVSLVMAIATINAWNRIAVTFRADVGSYQPRVAAAVG